MQMQNYTKIKDLQEKMAELSNPEAVDVSYDNSASHIDVNNLQAAVDRAFSDIQDMGTSLDRLNTSTDRIDTLLGDTDISEIGDGTVTGAIDDLHEKLGYTLIGTITSSTAQDLSEPVTNFNELVIIDFLTWIRGSITVPASLISSNTGAQFTYGYGSEIKFDAVIFDSASAAHKDADSYNGTIYIYGK